MTSPPLDGKRVLVIGSALASLAKGPLTRATIEIAGLERLVAVGPADADLILIDADACTAQALAGAVEALATRPAAPPVLLVGERLPTTVVRNLLRLDRSDVLDAPFTDSQIAGAIAGLMADAARSAAVPEVRDASASRCWAITGAVGGAGATTVAVEIATALCARTGKDKSVCLIDLNLADGSAPAYLGVTPTLRLADLPSSADRIDASMLQAFITPVTKQLDLLAVTRDPTGFEVTSRDVVLKVLEIACEAYEWVILDMPRHRHAWSLEALAGCDEVLVVSELTVPALIAARALSDEIEAALNPGQQPRIVLNRLASRMFGPAPSMAEAERALQRKAEGGIGSDWEAAAASVNLGGPIAQHRPKSKIVKDVQVLVERLASAPPRSDARGVRAA
jgi:pilus assembly protein CpaE